MRTGLLTLAAACVIGLAVGGCGDSDDEAIETSASEPPAATTSTAPEPAAPEPPAPDASAAEAGAEASPEAPAIGDDAVGELPDEDRAQVEETVRAYIDGLNAGDGAAACAAFAPGGLTTSELPVRRDGCAASLDASIGHRRGGGRPAWEKTEIATFDAFALTGDRARVTATVNHTFSDRKYSSVEEDVVYLEHLPAGWLILKPSATLYRAVGYPEPPLRAFTPPR